MQIERLIARDGIDADLARKMIAQQLSNDERIARAHDVIDNSRDGADLDAEVERLHQKYLELAGA